MSIHLNDVELTEQDVNRIQRSPHGPDETVRRALALYDELDEADEVIHDCGLLTTDGEG